MIDIRGEREQKFKDLEKFVDLGVETVREWNIDLLFIDEINNHSFYE